MTKITIYCLSFGFKKKYMTIRVSDDKDKIVVKVADSHLQKTNMDMLSFSIILM